MTNHLHYRNVVFFFFTSFFRFFLNLYFSHFFLKVGKHRKNDKIGKIYFIKPKLNAFIGVDTVNVFLGKFNTFFLAFTNDFFKTSFVKFSPFLFICCLVFNRFMTKITFTELSQKGVSMTCGYKKLNNLYRDFTKDTLNKRGRKMVLSH